MATTFVVETGAGVIGANSYSSVADATQYHEDFGDLTAWSALSPAEQERALRLATQFLDLRFGGRWRGLKSDETQGLDWPRCFVYDDDNILLEDNEIPKKIVEATAVMALLSTTEELIPDLSGVGTIKKEKNELGPLKETIEYQGGVSPLKKYRRVEQLVREFVNTIGMMHRA